MAIATPLNEMSDEQRAICEMVRQFARLAATVPDGPDRETRLDAAIRRALDEYER